MVYGTLCRGLPSPYLHSRVDSNTFTMGNPVQESTLTLRQSRLYPLLRDFGSGLRLHTISTVCLVDSQPALGVGDRIRDEGFRGEDHRGLGTWRHRKLQTYSATIKKFNFKNVKKYTFGICMPLCTLKKYKVISLVENVNFEQREL
jgi:hypothetical protein